MRPQDRRRKITLHCVLPAVCVLVQLVAISVAGVNHGLHCGYPGLPVGAVLHLEGEEEEFPVGTEVSYECEEGRVMTGESDRKCGQDGTWSGSLPVCRENLSLGQPCLQSGTLLNYEAAMAVDGDTETCSFTSATADQRWWQTQIKNTVVHSVAVAISPGSFQHFTIFVIELLEGSKALYKPCSSFKGTFDEAVAVFLCNGGDGHEGEFVYIRDDREEEEYFGLCEVQVFPMIEENDCGEPEAPVGSLVSVDDGLASYSCEAGYLLAGERSRVCKDGAWSGAVPACQELECPDPVSPKSGYIEVSNFKGRYQFGSVATYRCNPGFILWGNASRHCGVVGSWEGSSPSCNPISCGNPPAVVNGLVELINGSTSWQAVASYQCLPPFSNYGNENTTILYSSCLSDGTWSMVSLTCMFNPDAITTNAEKGRSLDWDDGIAMNISTIITIGVLSALIVLSLIIVIIIISHRKTTSEENARKISRSSTNQLIYDQVGLKDDEDYSRTCGVIVYDDLKTPHLVETDHDSMLDHYSSPSMVYRHSSLSAWPVPTPPGSVLPDHLRIEGSPLSERSSGDGGSDGEAGHYATVGRRMRSEAIYSSMRRPDGESDNDPYASIRLKREPDETNYESVGSEEQLYETLRQKENEKSISSETSSVSQVTVRQATQPCQANMADLYARVDMNKKRNRTSDSSLSPTSDTTAEVQDEAGLSMSGTPLTPPRSVIGGSERMSGTPVPAPRRKDEAVDP